MGVPPVTETPWVGKPRGAVGLDKEFPVSRHRPCPPVRTGGPDGEGEDGVKAVWGLRCRGREPRLCDGCLERVVALEGLGPEEDPRPGRRSHSTSRGA